MAVLIDHQGINWNVGTRSVQGVVPQGVSSFLIRLARKTTATPTFWADGVTVDLAVERSDDGGVTWLSVAGGGFPGGIQFQRDGVTEAPEALLSGTIPTTANRIRATLTISGARLVSEVTVEVN